MTRLGFSMSGTTIRSRLRISTRDAAQCAGNSALGILNSTSLMNLEALIPKKFTALFGQSTAPTVGLRYLCLSRLGTYFPPFPKSQKAYNFNGEIQRKVQTNVMGNPFSDQDDWIKAALSASEMKDNPWSSILSGIVPTAVPNTVPTPSQGSLYESMLKTPLAPPVPPAPRRLGGILGGRPGSQGTLPIPSMFASLPGAPKRFNKDYVSRVVTRSNKRIEVLEERINGISAGRVMPDVEEVTIGSGRQFTLAVLFLDICGFSTRPNWLLEDQKTVLRVMNIFMAEMLSIVHDFGGTYEKNTGDGLMAYFGEDEKDGFACVQPAAEAALIMHYVNDHLITPWLNTQGISPVTFRVGIDYGPVTIARVGIHGDKNSLVAIGTTANVANKIMKLIPGGGICVGDKLKELLPHNWGLTCVKNEEPSGFVYVSSQSPYPTWTLRHRLPEPLY